MQTYFRNNFKCSKTVSKIQIRHYFIFVIKDDMHNRKCYKVKCNTLTYYYSGSVLKCNVKNAIKIHLIIKNVMMISNENGVLLTCLIRVSLTKAAIFHKLNNDRAPLWSSGNTSGLQLQRFRVRLPADPVGYLNFSVTL